MVCCYSSLKINEFHLKTCESRDMGVAWLLKKERLKELPEKTRKNPLTSDWFFGLFIIEC